MEWEEEFIKENIREDGSWKHSPLIVFNNIKKLLKEKDERISELEKIISLVPLEVYNQITDDQNLK